MSYEQTAPQQSDQPPLDWPWYGIGFGSAIKRYFSKYATFSGRASRGEYWWVALLNALVYVVFVVIVGVAGGLSAANSSSGSGSADLSPVATVFSGLFGLYYLGIIIPSLAVAVRRLHDTGRSGWNYLFVLIPIAGPIILLVFLVGDTTPAAEQYGPPRSQPVFGGYAQPYPPAQGYGQPYGQQPDEQQLG